MCGGDTAGNQVIPPSWTILPTVSVVVTFTDQSVLDCLASLMKMAYPLEKLEIVAVDDSGDQRLALTVRRLFPLVRIVPNAHLKGSDGAKQTGMESSTGEIVAFTDSDCTVPVCWARIIAKNLSDEVAAVTGPVSHPKTLLREAIGILDFPDFQSLRQGWVNAFPGCNFAMRRNGFRYQRHPEMSFGSDRLISWRMYMDGLKIRYDPGMEVCHFPTVNVPSLLERRIRYGKKAIYLRSMDPTLPGALVRKLGPAAAPAYLCYKSLKDVRSMLAMVGRRQVRLLHMPILLPILFLLRLLDTIGVVRTQLRIRRLGA